MQTTLVSRSPTASLERLAALEAKVARAVTRGRAASTSRAYRSDWADFTVWCRTVGLDALPASPATVAAYVAELAEPGDARALAAVATITRRLAAIGEGHKIAGHTSPCTRCVGARDHERDPAHPRHRAPAEAAGDDRRHPRCRHPAPREPTPSSTATVTATAATGTSSATVVDNSNKDPAHEAAETPAQAAAEAAGQVGGGGGHSNTDAAHEAAETPAQVAAEAARDAALPASSTSSAASTTSG